MSPERATSPPTRGALPAVGPRPRVDRSGGGASKDWWANYLPGPDGTEPFPNAPVPDLDQLDVVEAVLTARPAGCRAISRRLGWGRDDSRYWLVELEKAGRARRVLHFPETSRRGRVFGWVKV